jgi:ATP-binding cassette, subfamily C (CFTR/MRP), member 1
VYYVPTSRGLKRLDSVSRSPIFSHFGETLEGTSTIRAFRMQPQFIRDNERHVDYNQQVGRASLSKCL